MDDELFTEPNDRLKEVINEVLNERQKEEPKEDNTEGSIDALVGLISHYTEAFKKAGYNRKEAVFLSGMILNGYTTGISNMLGGAV